MKKILIGAFFLVLANMSGAAQTCLESARIVPPVVTENARTAYQAKLDEAKAGFDKNPNSADAAIWLGRRTAYLGNYKEAIKIFSDGIAKFPQDARFLRHRGHRYLTIRCFDDAIRDFEKAAKLVMGKPDEIEPDGLPNARNTPTSTLQTNIFYHLGLAYYLKGDFDKSATAFMTCFNLSKNDDMRVAAAHWVYMSARRLGREKEAGQFISREIRDVLDIIENDDYHKLVRLYQGKHKAADLMTKDANSLSSASLGYGLGNWFLYNGNRDEAMKIFRQITSGNQWASFGFIAAEAELK